ncbi:DUF1554 domain-containing protein [Leptospira sp. WS58.C1]|uniref:DUF1554 domain-containing protein n=1 Tax=Leptospira TaxID=171 RepID=UPI0002C03C1C|nr:MULTISPECIES: DUF1554 domain-containing protein [unclassified Leptospira]EMJ98855.1 PF07588 family protein [Leptospira sp. B5-022]MCR1794624.1 DUF1554 domain-containing protein [Leptospira sp. id769339]
MALRITTLLIFLSGFFSSACSKPFPGGDELILLGILGKTRYLFVTTSPNTGNLGGVGGADLICQSAKTSEVPELPGSALEYVALIAASTRVPGGAGWPLLANTNYYAMDPGQTLIFHTNSSAIPVVPMDSATGIPGAGNYWTGISMTFGVGDTCLNWGDGTAGQFGEYGAPADNTIGGFNQGFSDGCDQPKSLLCVRN